MIHIMADMCLLLSLLSLGIIIDMKSKDNAEIEKI